MRFTRLFIELFDLLIKFSLDVVKKTKVDSLSMCCDSVLVQLG